MATGLSRLHHPGRLSSLDNCAHEYLRRTRQGGVSSAVERASRASAKESGGVQGRVRTALTRRYAQPPAAARQPIVQGRDPSIAALASTCSARGREV